MARGGLLLGWGGESNESRFLCLGVDLGVRLALGVRCGRGCVPDALLAGAGASVFSLVSKSWGRQRFIMDIWRSSVSRSSLAHAAGLRLYWVETIGTHDRANRYSSRVGLFILFSNLAIWVSMCFSTSASAVGGNIGPNNGCSVATSLTDSWRGKRTGSLEAPIASLSKCSEALGFRFFVPVYGVTGGDGKSISDCVRFRSTEMGGSAFISWPKDEFCFVPCGENSGLKLSKGLDSGGDIRVETEGRRFILPSLLEWNIEAGANDAIAASGWCRTWGSAYGVFGRRVCELGGEGVFWEWRAEDLQEWQKIYLKELEGDRWQEATGDSVYGSEWNWALTLLAQSTWRWFVRAAPLSRYGGNTRQIPMTSVSAIRLPMPETEGMSQSINQSIHG